VGTYKVKAAGAPGVPKVMLSDLHWGENVRPEQIGGVNEYSLPIARRRLRTVFETTIALCKILSPEMAYPGIVVPLGGDMVSGNIHDELAATNDINTMPTVLDIYKHLVPGIKLMADTFGNVFLPCVSGNHDRDTKKIWNKDRNHTSFGWLLYQFLALRFADDPELLSTFRTARTPFTASIILGTCLPTATSFAVETGLLDHLAQSLAASRKRTPATRRLARTTTSWSSATSTPGSSRPGYVGTARPRGMMSTPSPTTSSLSRPARTSP
jgi:hypothetical protein